MRAELIVLQPGYTDDPMLLVELAARVSRNSTRKMKSTPNHNFLGRLISRGELSPFEFARWTVTTDMPPSPAPGLIVTQTRRITEWLVTYNQRHILERADLRYLGQRFVVAADAMTQAQRLRHQTATILFSGISRACAAQLRTYRIASHVMRSFRYVSSSNWIIPDSITKNAEASAAWDWIHWGMSVVQRKFEELGIPQEDRRALYPMATETQHIVCAALGEWQHIIGQRTAENKAQGEIVGVVDEVREILREALPGVF